MLFRVLGPLEVDDPRGPVAIGGPVPRRVLTALLGRPGSVVSVDALVEAAWGEQPPASSERTLASHLTRLRDALSSTDGAAPTRVERRASGYLVQVPPDTLDAERFERLVGRAGPLPAAEAVPVYREALALWRSSVPFADLQDTAYPAAEAARLLELRGSAYEALVRAHLAAGQPEAAAADASGRLQDDPYREGLWEAYALALYRQGRRADALAACRRARDELAEGLGVGPGPALRRLEQQVLEQDPRLLVPQASRRHVCPYKGLARYDEADAALYVGRERLVDELLARLVDSRLVVVTGPSGAGKSSLVRAGLVAALSGGGLPGSASWSVAVVVPGADPLTVLDEALASRPDVLVLDQAEEALLAGDGGLLTDVGDRLLAATQAGTRVVLALRADFYGLLSQHPALARRVGPATVLVGPPSPADVRRIVVEPAARVGLRVEPELADLVVAEVGTHPGGLPVLSTALVRTWEHRDDDVLSVMSYHAGGGVRAALERVGEEAWGALLGDDERLACRRILLRLATVEDGAWVRRWAGRTELVHTDDRAGADALAALVDARLVVARSDDLGIAHEALLVGWPRLRGWLEDGRARTVVLSRLAAATTAWEQSERDPAELYRGTRLQAALDAAAASPDDVAPLEHAFLTESVALAERRLADARARAEHEARGRRRARFVAAVLAVTLVFATSAGVYAVTQQQRAQRAATREQQTALAADAERLGALAQSDPTYDHALLLAAQAVTLDPGPRTESDLFAALLRGDAVQHVHRESDVVSTVAYSRDGTSLVDFTLGGHLRRTPLDGEAGSSLSQLQAGGGFVETPRGTWLVENRPGNLYGDIEEIDPTNDAVLSSGAMHAGPVGGGYATTADDRTVAYVPRGGPDGPARDVQVWRVGTPSTTFRSVPVDGRPRALARCSGGLMCVVTDDTHRVVRIDPTTARVVGGFGVPVDTATAVVAASPDGRTLALAQTSGLVRLLDARTGRLLRVLGGNADAVSMLRFAPDGRRLAVGAGTHVLVWRTDRSGLPERYEGHGGQVTTGDWSPDGSTLATGAQDGSVIEWDTTGARSVGARLDPGFSGYANTLWTTPTAIVVGGGDGSLTFVDPTTGQAQVGRWTAPGFGRIAVITARAGRDGRLLATADARGHTAVWDVPTRTMLGVVDLPLPERHTYGVDTWISPDEKRGVSVRNYSGLVVFDPATRQVVAHTQSHPPLTSSDTVQGWTPDGRSLVVTDNDDLKLVDVDTGAHPLAVPLGGYAVEATADPTGHVLAVVLNDGDVEVFDAHDGHSLAPPFQAIHGVGYNVSFSPDGRYLAAAGWPAEATVWDTRTWQQVGTPLPMQPGAYDSRARFAPDGRLVVAGGTQLRTFDLEPQHWLARACREAGRILTPDEWRQVLPNRPYAPACA